MDYSVYIIQDRTKDNGAILKALTGDTGLGEHFANAAKAGVADALGADILDRYATTDALGENGVAIRGEMINSVSIKVELTSKEKFTEGTSSTNKFLSRVITVTGNLFAPSLIEMKSETAKNKNMAKVLAWANLSQTPSVTTYKENDIYGGDGGDIADGKAFLLEPVKHTSYITNPEDDRMYEKCYYRRVLVTVYSNKDTQFRATLYDKVFVSSYEEEYSDKDGNGKFTLVMKSIAANVFDVFVAGPTYKWSALAIADQVTSLASKHTKTTNKIVETIDKVGGTNFSEGFEKVTKKIDSATETANSLKEDNITIENMADDVNKQAENIHPTDMEDAIKKADEYNKAYDSLTAEQKAALKNIPDFDKLSQDEKMDYIDKLKDVVPTPSSTPAPSVQDMINAAVDHKKLAADYKTFYDVLTDDQKATLAYVPGFNEMDLQKKMEFLKTLLAPKDGENVPE